MKKIYLISAVAIIIGSIFAFNPYWFKFLWGWQILLIPLTAGILMVLVQDEDKSYDYVLKLLIGSTLTSFIYAFVFLVIDYANNSEYRVKSFLETIDIITISSFALPLVCICIFGGLIGLVIRGVSLLSKRKPESKFILVVKKIFGGLFLSIGIAGALSSVVIFLILLFHPSNSLLNWVMVDFKLIEVIGIIGYYLLLLSALFTVLIPIAFISTLGLTLFQRKNFFKLKPFLGLFLVFLLWLAIFTLLSFHVESRFKEKKAEMKENKSTRHFYIKDFDNINVSKFVKFDEITIKQGKQFSIVAKGSQYDQIGLEFEKINNDTLFIKRSELETYYNTDIWVVENRDNILFHAGTKHLAIEIIMPDIEKIEIEGGHIELVDFNVDNIEIKLNKRFNNIKGNMTVRDTLKLDARGGIINLVGSAKNLIINSGDCWIEMDRFNVENATINAKNTSRLNVNISNDMEIQLNENSGITNHYNK